MSNEYIIRINKDIYHRIKSFSIPFNLLPTRSALISHCDAEAILSQHYGSLIPADLYVSWMVPSYNRARLDIVVASKTFDPIPDDGIAAIQEWILVKE